MAKICDCAYENDFEGIGSGCEAFNIKPKKCWNRTTQEEKTKREKEMVEYEKKINTTTRREI